MAEAARELEPETPPERIARLRKRRGLTQEEMAQELAERGLPVEGQTISNYERGTRKPLPDDAH
jgi:transcriptional regulator with XRE-family HTH domain